MTIARPAQMPGKPLDVREYACTIMVAVVSEGLIGVAHVGDGCVVAGDGEQWQILSAPDNGEFANETKFLTNPRNLPRVTVVSRSDISCLAVTTDGLQDVAFSRRSLPYKRFWTPYIAHLADVRVRRRTEFSMPCSRRLTLQARQLTTAPSQSA